MEQNEDKSRVWLAIALCFAFYVAWQKYYLEPRLPKKTEQSPIGSNAATGADQSANIANQAGTPVQGTSVTAQLKTATTPATQIKLEAQTLDSAYGEIQVSNDPMFIQQWKMKNHGIELSGLTHSRGQAKISFDSQDANYNYLSQVYGTLLREGNAVTWTYDDAKIKLTRKISLNSNEPTADLVIHAQFKAPPPKSLFINLYSTSPEGDTEAMDRGLVYITDNALQKKLASKGPDQPTAIPTDIHWMGVQSRYFLMALINTGAVKPTGVFLKGADNHEIIGSLQYPITGSEITIPLKAYFGAKELTQLRAIDPSLDLTVDFGMFTIVAYPLLRTMKWFYSLFHNWGVAIILLTLLVKVLTFPLTYKSMKAMKKMAKLQPKLKQIQEKYKDNKEALNREMMTMMKTHGYNPASGCLPILIQMPVFFALYQVFLHSFELYQAPFMLWIHDLSIKDPFYVTPLLLTVVMFVQQKLTPNTSMDPAQAKMMQFMPIMFGAMMVTLPSGLTLYMLINALASIGQQMYLNKRFDDGSTAVLKPT